MEKTFEQLIEENTNWNKDIFGGYDKTISPKKVLKLMQQVREATIAECRKCLTIQGYDDVPMSFFEQKYKMNQLPTDRIKLTDK